LKISVQNGERLSLEQIRAFLECSEELQFEAGDRQELYQWVGQTLDSRNTRNWDGMGKDSCGGI
jgi:hypothetical protein